MIVEQVKQISGALRLNGIYASFAKRAEQATEQSLNHLEFLRLVLEDERLQRQEQKAKALLTRAKFRTVADLEDLDMSYDRGLSKTALRELGRLDFYHALENLLMFGKTGEGKTHLAIALGRRLCRENISTLFLPTNFLFEEVLAARAAGKYLSYIKKLIQAKVLILDDFGLRNYSHDEASVLVDILEERHRKGSVIVTSQVDPKGWEKLFEDPVIAEAVVNRLTAPSQRIALKGGSYREKLQMKLPQGTKS